MFDVSACSVERTQDQHYFVRWQGPRPGQKVSIYITECPNHFYTGNDRGDPVLETTNHEALIANPDTKVRHYFLLKTECGETITLAERQLSLQGTPNFRDLGGYEVSDGRRLKWGKLYRSGKLSALSDRDIDYINRLGVSLVCDFRKEMERELEPSRFGEGKHPQYADLPITPGSSESFMTNLHKGILDLDDAAGFMEEINRDFVINHLHQYAEMFRLLLVDEHHILIHCASGKDRTGFGSALILDVLGVGEETIIEDYLLTNQYLPIEKELARLSNAFTDQAGSVVPEEVLRPMLEVRPEYINACFEEIKKRYESKEHFFESALNLNNTKVALLKDRYLD